MPYTFIYKEMLDKHHSEKNMPNNGNMKSKTIHKIVSWLIEDCNMGTAGQSISKRSLITAVRSQMYLEKPYEKTQCGTFE